MARRPLPGRPSRDRCGWGLHRPQPFPARRPQALGCCSSRWVLTRLRVLLFLGLGEGGPAWPSLRFLVARAWSRGPGSASLPCFCPLLHLQGGPQRPCPAGPRGHAREGTTEGMGGLVHAPWPRLASLQWMRARWTSDPCYAFFGVDGTECSFLTYLSEVEWFCPPLPGRNQTATQMAPKPLPKVQVCLGGEWALEGWVDRPAGLPGLDILGGQRQEAGQLCLAGGQVPACPPGGKASLTVPVPTSGDAAKLGLLEG